MMKNVLIAGASGMIGQLILANCVKNDEVLQIISFVRKPMDNQSTKVKEVVVEDFAKLDKHSIDFNNIDAAFFCLGAYTGQVNDALFKRITVDFSVEFARMIKINSPNAKLCLLSGAGADRSEKSKTSFARYKGMAENKIHAMGLNFYTFRPGYIYPVKPRKEPNFLYRLMRVLYPLLKYLGPNASITSVDLANAMVLVGRHGYDSEIIENKEIWKLALTSLNEKTV